MGLSCKLCGHIINLMSDPEGNSFVFGRVIRTRGKTKPDDSPENKTNWFPEGPGIKCFVIFLDSHSQQQKITGVNQNSRLGTYNNTNLILKTTE